MGNFLRFIAEQNEVGLAFEKTTAKNVNKWLAEHDMSGRFKASRFRPGRGQRSENFPDVYVESRGGDGFFIECKQYSRANMLNARFDIDENCQAKAKDGKYSGLADMINGSDQFRRFRRFMTSEQKALDGARPIDVYSGKARFDPKKLVPKYNRMVRGGLVEADCKEFDTDVIRKSTAGAMSCALAWRLSNKNATWDICRVKADFGPYLLGKYGGEANVKYIQLGENLFVIDPDDNPLGLDAPAFPKKVDGIFSLRFTPRFGVGGMYITPRSELTGELRSERDFNCRDRWPEPKGELYAALKTRHLLALIYVNNSMKDDETTEKPEIAGPEDILECAKFDVDDDFLADAKIAAYMYNIQLKNEEGELKPYLPKFFPEKAIDIMVYKSDEFIVEIFLLSKTGEWDSKFRYDNKICKLSPEQMGQFFTSDFYRKMLESVSKKWPTTDPTYEALLKACVHKKMRVGFSENELLDGLQEVDQPNKRVDLANKDLTGDGKRDYTSTGRRIVKFGDMGVKGNSGEYYCWPNPKFPFKWSQWKDWRKIKPLCKMTFKYNGRRYMISLSPFDENFDNRGFRGADTQWTPPLAWLTPGECAEVMELSIVRRFTKECVRRIKKYLDMTPQEVYEKINNKDKITVKEIEKTQRVIKHVISTALKGNQADTYCWD